MRRARSVKERNQIRPSRTRGTRASSRRAGSFPPAWRGPCAQSAGAGHGVRREAVAERGQLRADATLVAHAALLSLESRGAALAVPGFLIELKRGEVTRNGFARRARSTVPPASGRMIPRRQMRSRRRRSACAGARRKTCPGGIPRSPWHGKSRRPAGSATSAGGRQCGWRPARPADPRHDVENRAEAQAGVFPPRRALTMAPETARSTRRGPGASRLSEPRRRTACPCPPA